MSSSPRTRRARRNAVAALVAAVVLLAGGAAAAGGLAAHAAHAASVRTGPPAAEPPTSPALDSPAAEGVLPAGTPATDDRYPGITNLDPALLTALREAAGAASADGVVIDVTSGWRSPAYQERLLADAVADYGSAAEAARWVATPDTSLHVSGDAVDVGFAASLWLADEGPRFGLCRIYDNEPWHFELRADAASVGCPALYADPTHDPRLRR